MPVGFICERLALIFPILIFPTNQTVNNEALLSHSNSVVYMAEAIHTHNFPNNMKFQRKLMKRIMPVLICQPKLSKDKEIIT